MPGDEVRQTLWRFHDRYDLQMLVQSVRSVARGPVARLVAEGARNTHEFTAGKAALIDAYDASGITAVFMEPDQGGFIEGPKNLALALVAFELAWVDAGAATASLAGCLALSPIHERGTDEQRDYYMSRCTPPQPGEDRKPWRGAFCLTEPIPYVGVDTGMLNGKVRVAEWSGDGEPMLQVDKRGRFITNMAFANFVTAAVDSADERIKGSCMVVLEEADPGTFDRGTPTRKMAHQLSSTSDPIFSMQVPASRIIGGYEVRDGKIIPKFNHSQIIEAVFKRTRVTVAVMTSAKLLSAVEPIIRYQRGRFRGAEQVSPGTVRYELGLQQRQDVLHRLLGLWSIGEAGASLGFAAARLFDELDPLEREKFDLLEAQGISGGKAEMKLFRDVHRDALELLEIRSREGSPEDDARYRELMDQTLVRYALLDSVAGVLCPAAKLWNTGVGATTMREAVSLMGGYGITEDCPGFLANKWIDAQLEATYEGPESVQRRQLSVTITNELFLAQFRQWTIEMRQIAARLPDTGACLLATAMTLWLWTYEYLCKTSDADGAKLYHSPRQGVTFPLADALCWLLASRHQILDAKELREKGADDPALAEALPGTTAFFDDLCHVQAARAAGEVGRICAELVYGYSRHPVWSDGDDASDPKDRAVMESVVPGVCSCSADGRPAKAGPCMAVDQLEPFQRLRAKLDSCLSGAQLAKDRAANAVSKVMIPEALDYPS